MVAGVEGAYGQPGAFRQYNKGVFNDVMSSTGSKHPMRNEEYIVVIFVLFSFSYQVVL